MNNLKYVFALTTILPILLFSNHTLAVEVFEQSKSICQRDKCTNISIDRLYISNGGHDHSRMYIGTNADETSLSVCNPVSSVYIRIEPDDDLSDIMYQTLLTAQIENKRVTLRVKHNDDTTEDCILQYMTIDRQ